MQTMKKDFGVVFVQMLVIDDKQTNIKHAERLIRTAVEKFKPKMVVLPEYFNTKWGKMHFEKVAETFPTGETFVMLERVAKELDIYVVGGSMPERDNKNVLFNTTVVFAPSGKLIAKYRKIHLMDIELEKTLKSKETDYVKLRETDVIKAGNELTIFEVDGVKVGLGIGYDLFFDELTRLYRKKGVEMVIFPSAIPATFGDLKWEQLNRARAIDNEMYVMGVAQARDDQSRDVMHFGRSMLVDYRGKVMVRAGDDEELLYAYVKFDELEMFRKKTDIMKNKRDDIYETISKM